MKKKYVGKFAEMSSINFIKMLAQCNTIRYNMIMKGGVIDGSKKW